jgi:uracil-DNA glycosylase family 4
MGRDLDNNLRQAIAERLDFYRELGIYDFYRRSDAALEEYLTSTAASAPPEVELVQLTGAPENAAEELRRIREDLGDCTRCVLHKQGRKQIVFGTGNPDADLMFVGEGPGADEDEQGIPFVGRAGQLLTSMITNGMGLRREDVYIANVVKCRPPGNRTPEREECDTCSPFLFRQIEAVNPKVVVALGAVAARTLLQVNEPMAALRGRWHDFRGRKLAVTYHPAYLLRDPRQKKETWKDLQMVMQYLELPIPAKNPTS